MVSFSEGDLKKVLEYGIVFDIIRGLKEARHGR